MELRRLERIAPDDSRTDFARATFLTSQGQYAKAVGPLRRVVAANPRAEHYAALSIAHIMSGSLAEAADDMALLNRLRYRPADARADAQRAISLGIPRRRAEPLL